jgi:heme A synthase
VRWLAVGALLAYLAQALVGAVFVVTSAAPIWGVAHVGLAALTWSLLVAVSAIDTLNSRPISQEVTQKQDHPVWTPQS